MPRPLRKLPGVACPVVLLLASALLSALVDPGAAQGQAGSLGPLTAEEGAPLQRLGLTPTVEGADLVARGALRAEVWAGYANVFEQDSASTATLYLDMERMITALTFRYGLHERLEVGARATLETTWGGFLDGYVMLFHWSLGVGNRNRPDFPQRAYGQRLENADGEVLVDIPRRTFGIEDLRVFAKWRVAEWEDGRGVLALKATTRVPTAENTIGEERVDVGLAVLGRATHGGWSVHAMAGATSIRRSPGLEAALRSGPQWYGMVGLERRVHPRLSVVAQLTASSQLLRDFGDHDVSGTPSNAILGIVGVTEGGWRWELALQEDVPPWGPSTDFTLQAAIGRSW